LSFSLEQSELENKKLRYLLELKTKEIDDWKKTLLNRAMK
jgi:hypothetical protein